MRLRTRPRRVSVHRGLLAAAVLVAVGAVVPLAGALPVASAGASVAQSFGAAAASPAASLSASPAHPTTAGDLLVATIRDRNTSAPAPVVAVTDSTSDHWLPAVQVAKGQADGAIWYATGAAALSTTQSVTVTVGGSKPASSTITFTVVDVTGVTSASLDVTASNSGSTASASTGTTTTAQAGDVVVADIGWNSTVGLSSQSAGYTQGGTEQAKVSGVQAGEQAAWLLPAAATPQSYAATLKPAAAWTGEIAAFGTGAVTTPTPTPTTSPPPAGSDWPEYRNDPLGNGFTSETLINPSNAAQLQARAGWPVALTNGATCPSAKDTCSNMVFSQPVVATVGGNTLVYVGSWNGSEFALCSSSCTIGANTYTSGQVVWSAYLGRTSGCGGPQNSKVQGLTSAGAVATETVNGVSQPVLFVGGGGDIAHDGTLISNPSVEVLALNALTGAVLWTTPLAPAPHAYPWTSPLLANGSVYMGIASVGDCPVVQGQVFRIDPGTGAVQSVFDVVPNGCVGGGVWGSATVDASGNVYVTTGNPGTCGSAEPYGPAIVELTPALSVIGSWQVPTSEQTSDSDFGSTPTLFTGTVTPGGQATALVGAVNKNGIFYVMQQNNLGAGPVARLRVSTGVGTNFKGQSIAPGSWDGHTLYVAGGNTSFNSTSYTGSVQAYDPDNLATPLWQAGFTSGTVIAAVTTDPGLVVVEHAGMVSVVNSATGAVEFADTDSSASFWGAASIAHGVVYVGDTSGDVHAYSVNGT